MIIFGLQGRLCVEGSWYSSGTQQVHVVVWAVRFNRPIMAANDIGPARAASPSIGGSGGSGGAGQGGGAENECMICLSNFEPGQAIRVSRFGFDFTERTEKIHYSAVDRDIRPTQVQYKYVACSSFSEISLHRVQGLGSYIFSALALQTSS